MELCKTCGGEHPDYAGFLAYKKAEDLRVNILVHSSLYWSILKAKILYYSPLDLNEATVNELLPSDDRYDQMERAYLKKCQVLNLPNVLVHKSYPGTPEHLDGTGMMEVDWDHQDIQTAYRELLDAQKTKGT